MMMSRFSRRDARRTRGVALVETALAIVVILAMLFGILDMGITFWVHQTIAGRASQAARWASVAGVLGNEATVKKIVLCGSTTCTGSFYGLTEDMIAVTRELYSDFGTSSGPTSPTSRRHVRVTITGFTLQQFTPFFGRLIASAPIIAAQPMECELEPCFSAPPPG